MRYAGEMRNPRMGALFLHANRNKRSVSIDVRHPAGREALLRLCAGADGFVHNVRQKAMGRLGLAYEDIAGVNPGIVYLSLIGYGSGGTYAGRAAYDDLIQGISGLAAASQLGGGDTPRFVPSVVADRISGLAGVNALLAALLHRERTGEGQAVEVPMFETLVQIVLGDHFGGHTFQPPTGPWGYSRLTTPNRRPYKTQDGHICVLVYNDRQWQKFFAAIGRLDIWESDPRFADQATRARHYDAAYGMLAHILLGRKTDDWLDLFEQNDIPAVPLRAVPDLPDDPHLQSVGMIETVEHPTEGVIRQIRPPPSFSKTPAVVTRHAPNVGEHSRELLGEAGLSTTEIGELIVLGVVTQFGDPPRQPARRQAPGQPMENDDGRTLF